MKMTIEKTIIEGAVFLHPEPYRDDRGFFLEAYRQDAWREAGFVLPEPGIVQWNHSGSVRNVVRGLHFQWSPPMGKLMRITAGSAFVVAVDIRKGSPTFGKWVGRDLRAEEPTLFWAPAGCARGFAVTSDFAELMYLCTGTYNSNCESGILWNDPAIGIDWPVADPILAPKDANARTLAEWTARPESDFFQHVER